MSGTGGAAAGAGARRRPRPEEDAHHRAEPGPRHPRPDPVAHLRRPHRLRADLREALRDRRGPAHPSPARRRPARGQRRRQDGRHQAAAERQVQRRHAARRRGRPLLARAPPDDEGLQPQERAGVGERGRGRRCAHRPPAPQGAVLAADRPARRPGRHAGVAGRRHQARRQVRHRAGVRGALAVRRACPAGPHRRRALAALLRQGSREVRPDRVPHHPRRQRAGGQPPQRRHRRHAPGGAHRCRQPAQGRPFRGLQRHRAGLQLGHDQPAQQDRQDAAAGQPRHAAGQ